jgi:hypothetical protein
MGTAKEGDAVEVNSGAWTVRQYEKAEPWNP